MNATESTTVQSPTSDSASRDSTPAASNEAGTTTPPRLSTPTPISRPGISSATIAALGIRRVDADEAYELVDIKCSGIYIPFFNDFLPARSAYKEYQARTAGRPYGRLRLDPEFIKDGKKYHQEWKSGVHNYVQPSLALYNGDLLLVEGEFKSIALTEAGFPAIGISGFYSWSQKRIGSQPRVYEPAFRRVLESLRPQRLVYVGDSDTATNFQFWDAMVQLSIKSNLPIVLPRIDYSAPYGKGVDDIRGNMTIPGQFDIWFREAIRTAEVIMPTTTRDELMSRMLNREYQSIRTLTGSKREEAKDRLIKSGGSLSNTALDVLSTFAEETLGVAPSSFKKDARAYAKRKREEEREKKAGWSARSDSGTGDNRDGPITNFTTASGNVLDEFFMIGKEYYGYTVDPVTNERSKTVSLCDRSYVSFALQAAGYSTVEDSSEDTPVCGEVPHLSEYKAALYYLHKTRFVAMADRLFRPYGPIREPDGTRIFNNSQVQVTQPTDTPSIYIEGGIEVTMRWLKALLPGDQLDHFLTLLSYVYCAALAGKPKKTRAVFLVGAPDTGKSFLIDHFLPRIFGQTSASNAHRLFKNEVGASSVLKSYVCKLSDADLGGTAEVARLQQGILSLLADHTTSGRLMYQNVTTEEVINLFMFSSNPDGSTINLLKNMPASILDKFAVYHCGDGLKELRKPIDYIQDEEDEKNGFVYVPKPLPDELIPVINDELPHFCLFLKNWKFPEQFKDPQKRFGVAPYFADSLTKYFAADDDEAILIELLRGKEFREERAGAIFRAIATNGNPTDQRLLSSIRPQRFSHLLTSLSKILPTLVQATEYLNPTLSGVKNRTFDITGKEFARIDKESAMMAKAEKRIDAVARVAAEEKRLEDESKRSVDELDKLRIKKEADFAARVAAGAIDPIKAEEEMIAADYAEFVKSKEDEKLARAATAAKAEADKIASEAAKIAEAAKAVEEARAVEAANVARVAKAAEDAKAAQVAKEEAATKAAAVAEAVEVAAAAELVEKRKNITYLPM